MGVLDRLKPPPPPAKRAPLGVEPAPTVGSGASSVLETVDPALLPYLTSAQLEELEHLLAVEVHKTVLAGQLNKYIPQVPHPKQREFIHCTAPEVLFGGAASGGKALKTDTPIPTPKGWIAMGDLTEGDYVFGTDGVPCKVTRAFDAYVPAECYRVVFDTGDYIDACGDHQWVTRTAAETSKTRTTKEIAGTLYHQGGTHSIDLAGRLLWTPRSQVLRLARKAERLELKNKSRTANRKIVSCDRIEPCLMRCIAVDSPDHCYLAGRGMIPTHNSSALLMAALQYVEEPGYSAIIFRRTFADLNLPGALIPRSKEWLTNTDAVWKDDAKTWHFPSGATLSFGYLENSQDRYRYQGAEFQFIAFDELTQFQEQDYLYLFSRLRRLSGSKVPCLMRSTSNPGGQGHAWVKQRFLVEGPSKGRLFLPAGRADNPSVDQESYARSLESLDPLTRMQLRDGNWDVTDKGPVFDRGWFEIVPAPPPDLTHRCRWWDLAATEAKKGKDPDWTAGALLGCKDGIFYVLDMQRWREKPAVNEQRIKDTAARDGRGTMIGMEQEPGSGGVNTIDHYARHVLQGLPFEGKRSTGSKAEYARPLSSAAQKGNVKLVQGAWIGEFLDELEAFPVGAHDDQVDAAAHALAYLSPLNAEVKPLVEGPLPGTDAWNAAEVASMKKQAADAVRRKERESKENGTDFLGMPLDGWTGQW